MNAEEGRPRNCYRVGGNHRCEYWVVPVPVAVLYREIDNRDIHYRESIGVSGFRNDN